MNSYMILGVSQEQLESAFTDCVLYAKSKAQDTVPIDTGNMRYHAFKNRKTAELTHSVYFDLGDETRKHANGKLDGIAPYAKWTNERRCRIQGWFDNKTVETFTEELQRAVTLMINMFGINVESVTISQKEEESNWNTLNT